MDAVRLTTFRISLHFLFLKNSHAGLDDLVELNPWDKLYRILINDQNTSASPKWQKTLKG
jgi:hypothetical protein